MESGRGALESSACLNYKKGDFISQAPPQDKHDGYRLVDFDGMVELVATPPDARPMQIVDARPQVRFSGQMPEPRPGMASGHMPGAINCPITALIEQGTGKIKPPETLKNAFSRKPTSPWINGGDHVRFGGDGLRIGVCYGTIGQI